MQCAECGVRSAVGYCAECETLLCEVCGRTCSECGKIACRSHLQRTSSGRNICVSCVVLHYDKRARQSKERRERRAEEVALGGKARKHHKHTHEPENLSFEALARDLGPVSTPLIIPAPREEQEAPAPFEPSHHHEFDHGPLRDRDALNARVLTGSAATRTPPWLSGISLGAVSWLLVFAATGPSDMALQQGILSAVALLLSLGTVVWTASGALSKVVAPGRNRCRIALAIGAGALLFSGILLAENVL